jgi:transcriptional regulator with XRE-family HTH domain
MLRSANICFTGNLIFVHNMFSTNHPCHEAILVGKRKPVWLLIFLGGHLMITAIREVRRAKGMTLADVAEACTPPTTAQTIGRLETGTRTVSVGWLNRIAGALGVSAADLVKLPDRADLPVVAVLSSDGVNAPRHETTVSPPTPGAGAVSILVETSIGEYRAGDEIWCDTIAPDHFADALNRDVILPRPAGRFIFGRLIGREGSRLQILPLGAGAKQQIIEDPAWAGVAVRLVRAL